MQKEGMHPYFDGLSFFSSGQIYTFCHKSEYRVCSIKIASGWFLLLLLFSDSLM